MVAVGVAEGGLPLVVKVVESCCLLKVVASEIRRIGIEDYGSELKTVITEMGCSLAGGFRSILPSEME